MRFFGLLKTVRALGMTVLPAPRDALAKEVAIVVRKHAFSFRYQVHFEF
jgi:hypothetical protein